MYASQDAIKGNSTSAPSSAMQSKDDETYTETGPGKRDLDKAQVQSTTKTNLVVELVDTHAHPLDPQYQCTPTPIEQSGPSSSESMRYPRPFLVDQASNMDIADDRTPNIVIFGETGVGKSSVINLIADEKRANTSNDALGCTFDHKRHIVKLDETQCALWDTTGLDEGTQGTVPAQLAEANLKALISTLARSGGIHLVIYCIRGTRLTTALKRNYDLFYVTVCRKKVPVALVVTGLEHQQGDMGSWWGENEAVLKRSGMWFDDHACVTTLDVNDAVIRERRLDSQRRLRELVIKHAGKPPWKIEPSLIPFLLRILTRGATLSNRKTIRRVVIYDRAASHGTRTRSIGNLEYEWVPVTTPFSSQSMGFGRPSVLVFHTSPLVNDSILPEDITALKTFYDVAGGRTCPMIVVLRGCNDDQVAQECWDVVVATHEDIRARCIADAPEKLDEMVERLCIEHIEISSLSRFWRVYATIMQFFSRAWRVGS